MARSSSGRLSFALTTLALLACPPLRAVALDFPGPAPGPAQAHVDDKSIVLENNVLRASWKIVDGHLRPDVFLNKLSGEKLDWGNEEVFRFTYAHSPLPAQTMSASQFDVDGKGEVKDLPSEFHGSTPVSGKIVTVGLKSLERSVMAVWTVALRDDTNYVRQCWSAGGMIERGDLSDDPLEIQQAAVLEGKTGSVEPAGVVDGVPVVTKSIFLGVDNPFGKNHVDLAAGAQSNAKIRCTDASSTAFHRGGFPDMLGANNYDDNYTSVLGVAPPGQMRRAFLCYLEGERAAPYYRFLHYNNGAEIGCEYWRLHKQGKLQEAAEFCSRQEKQWINLIRTFGHELTEKRSVRIDSFVHDHGWDDPNLVWQFHVGYPQGFEPARQAADRYGSQVGVWFSPWGGYEAKKLRIDGGQAQGFEVNKSGLSAAGPRYNARLSTACENMIRLYGVNYFKFDGFAGGINKPGPEPYTSDVEALLLLCTKLRERNPNVFINATTGSWPSPFWLRWVDSIWRQGHDTNLGGKGSDRQRWITYRDGQILHGTLERAPLFPVNSLMIHGIYVNKLPLSGNPYDPKSTPATHDPADVTAEIRSFFGTGVNCQELYINPELMTPALWDVLAEGAKWSRANSDVLVDTHWVGGDPLKGEVYGFASWQPRKGILTLRNPNDQAGRITLDVGQVFELPAGAATHFTLKCPWKSDATAAPRSAQAGQPLEFALQPFEVLVLEAVPN